MKLCGSMQLTTCSKLGVHAKLSIWFNHALNLIVLTKRQTGIEVALLHGCMADMPSN